MSHTSATIHSMLDSPSLESDRSALRRATAIIDRMATAIWVYDIDRCRVLRANAAACEIWQSPTEALLIDRDLGMDMSVAVRERLAQYQREFKKRDAVFDEYWTVYPSNQPSNLCVRFSGQPLASGRMAMLCEVIGSPDIQPDTLRSAEALLHTSVMISLFDDAGKRLYANPPAQRQFFGAQQDLESYFAEPEDHRRIVAALIEQGEARAVVRIEGQDDMVWHDITARICHDAITGGDAILLTQIDVTELKQARDRANYLATRDPLTGLRNRHYVQYELGDRLAANAARGGTASLIYVDLDHFKQINDALGHDVGDEVIKVAAARLREVAGPDADIARLGGDEFLVLIDDENSNQSIGELCRGSINQPAMVLGHRLELSASIGVSQFPSDGQTIGALMRAADLALYVAKQEGRNQVVEFAPDMAVRAQARVTLEQELRLALDRKELVLHYQPRFDARNHRVVSLEALVRWQHPERGLLGPRHFIEIAEETGLIEPLGDEVLRLATNQHRSWLGQGIDVIVSINVSKRQLDGHFVARSGAIMEAMGVSSERIEFEITESMLSPDNDVMTREINGLAKRGHLIDIDDFGTGYSNLGVISDFPISSLKIDQSFVQRLPETDAIVRMIINLANHLGCRVVGEGVETEAQRAWLEEFGCHELQGFLLGRPKPADEMSAYFAQAQVTT